MGLTRLQTNQIAPAASTITFTAGSQSAMLALTAQTNDFCIRTDAKRTFVLTGTDPTNLAHWQEVYTIDQANVTITGGSISETTITTGNIAIIGNITGSASTVTANAQPAITSVGTLSNLSVTGNIDVTTGNIVIPKTSGNGILIDTASPGYGWKDLVGPITIRGAGAQDPVWTAYNGVIYQYQFTTGDEVTTLYHIPHDWAPGTNMYIHAHWSLAAAGITENCTWTFDVVTAKGYNQAAFSTVYSMSILQASSTTQYQHMIAETPMTAAGGAGGLVPTANLEVDGLIIVRTRLSANSGSTKPFLHCVDIHYQTTGIDTKQRNGPNFYT